MVVSCSVLENRSYCLISIINGIQEICLKTLWVTFLHLITVGRKCKSPPRECLTIFHALAGKSQYLLITYKLTKFNLFNIDAKYSAVV